MTQPDLPQNSDQPSPDGHIVIPRTKLRRGYDRSLLAIAIFLFIINVVFGTYIFVTTNRVDGQAEDLTKLVCVQNAAYQGALERERKLIKTGPPEQREVHEKSVAQLETFLGLIVPLVDCSDVEVKLPPELK